MTRTSAAAGLLRSMARTPPPQLDIPLVTCPACEKRRPMTIKRVVPHLRASHGANVEFGCASCGAAERRTVRPISA